MLSTDVGLAGKNVVIVKRELGRENLEFIKEFYKEGQERNDHYPHLHPPIESRCTINQLSLHKPQAFLL